MLNCPSCNTACPDEANYCLHCGTFLKKKSDPNKEIPSGTGKSVPNETMTQMLKRLMPTSYAEKLLATKGKMEGERRVVTILFSDVKGSTSMGENLDPEEVMEIMNGAFNVLIEPITRYEGTLARLMGDAILAFFGAPITHEDDPDRACRAAIEIINGGN
jgi:class 3 adenylate cyclase